ncbi:fluoride efflux transporter FluC [Nocardia mexicana]|uniref:Fluoride-specific ion channel FluC n=1 Tax=Nocardia mexicana TaxID=279262 RepID=A0A370HJF8_9NOCA|nr:CrcB family protein [Nocardia mexicana]RDI55629.1 CrcB protein [Nocardia mexicana]
MTSRQTDRPDRRGSNRSQGAVLLAVALGGGLGAVARYGLAQWWPTPPGGFPWATFVTNVTGCFLIGVLMVAVAEIWIAHPLIRPFLGVGVLGGFTTFSTYANEIGELLRPGEAMVACVYLVGTLASALLATVAAMRLTRACYDSLRHRRAVR